MQASGWLCFPHLLRKKPLNLKLKKVFYFDFLHFIWLFCILTFVRSCQWFFSWVFLFFQSRAIWHPQISYWILRTKIHKCLLNTALKVVPSYSFWIYQYWITVLINYYNSDLLKGLPVSSVSQVTTLWGGTADTPGLAGHLRFNTWPLRAVFIF